MPFLSIYEALLRLDEGNQRVQLELEQLDFEHPVLAVRLVEMRRRLEEMAEKLIRVKVIRDITPYTTRLYRGAFEKS